MTCQAAEPGSVSAGLGEARRDPFGGVGQGNASRCCHLRVAARSVCAGGCLHSSGRLERCSLRFGVWSGVRVGSFRGRTGGLQRQRCEVFVGVGAFGRQCRWASNQGSALGHTSGFAGRLTHLHGVEFLATGARSVAWRGAFGHFNGGQSSSRTCNGEWTSVCSWSQVTSVIW